MEKNLDGHELTIQDSGAPRGERNHWEVTLNGVVLYSDYNGKKANSLFDAVESALTDMAPKSAQLPSQGGEAVEVVASIAVDEEGVVRDFTLEPGLDRHPGGYTVTPLMTLAQHQRILAATVGSGDPVAWRVTGRDGLTVTAQYPEWAESDCLLTIAPLYTHPADQVGGVVVSRELLERIVKRGMRLPDDTQRQHLGELRALLDKP